MVNSNSGKNPKKITTRSNIIHAKKKGFLQKINFTVHQAEILKKNRIYGHLEFTQVSKHAEAWKGDFFLNLLFTRWKKLGTFLNFFKKSIYGF